MLKELHHARGHDPLTFYGSKAGATFRLAMVSIGSGVKPRASQRCRNNYFSDWMENGAPPNYLANRKAPPTMLRPRGGGMASDLTGSN